MMSEDERPAPPEDPVARRVYDVIGDLTKHTVAPDDRRELRKALDRADTPPTGRAASDRALGNLSGNRR